METKQCRTCKQTKEVSLFSKYSNRKSYMADCKRCVADKQSEYRKNNPKYYSNVLKRGKDKYWKKRNAELPELLVKLETERTCTTCGFTGSIDLFVKKNRGKAINSIRLRGTCKKCRNIQQKEWGDKNPEKKKQYNKKTYDRRKKDETYMQFKKQIERERYQDPEVKQKIYEWQRKSRMKSQIHIWRRLLKNSLTQLSQEKTTKTQLMLGYTAYELYEHIGNKPGDEYAIDHRIPLSWLEQTTPANIACNLHNLQWLTKTDNLKKNNHYADEIPLEFFQVIKPYIKEKYQTRFTIEGDMVYDNKKEYILLRWQNNLSSIEA